LAGIYKYPAINFSVPAFTSSAPFLCVFVPLCDKNGKLLAGHLRVSRASFHLPRNSPIFTDPFPMNNPDATFEKVDRLKAVESSVFHWNGTC